MRGMAVDATQTLVARRYIGTTVSTLGAVINATQCDIRIATLIGWVVARVAELRCLDSQRGLVRVGEDRNRASGWGDHRLVCVRQLSSVRVTCAPRPIQHGAVLRELIGVGCIRVVANFAFRGMPIATVQCGPSPRRLASLIQRRHEMGHASGVIERRVAFQATVGEQLGCVVVRIRQDVCCGCGMLVIDTRPKRLLNQMAVGAWRVRRMVMAGKATGSGLPA